MNTENINFQPTLKDLIPLDLNLYEPKFIFEVDDKKYEVSRIIADIISPVVRNYHFTDKSSCNIDYFQKFLNFFTSSEGLCDDSTSYKYYLAYSLQIGNNVKYLEIIDYIKEKLTTENVVDLLLDLLKADLYNESLHPIIDYISTNFNSIEKEKLVQLQPEVLSEIIANDNFPIKNDELLDYLLDLYQENQDYSLLFSCIDFCKLKKHKLTEFAKKVNFNDLDQNTWINIWTNISEYLENTASKNCLLIQFNENADFCGIIHYLKYTKKIGISITSTPPFSEYYSEVNNIIDFEDADKFYLMDENSSGIICFDFGIYSVNLSHYSLMAIGDLKSWTIEVSNDNNIWELVDENVNSTVFNSSDFIIANFQIVSKISTFSRYVRFHQNDSKLAAINKIEFYGFLE
ncbi:hypothetical protein M9Y10_011701 [Tritrichomonas musculus]|uniref:F5/8 type C domain-containing protein n=1 Tax=Tritrichomonas musculus TaxID=1915356 RepID=A0ABR2IK54_9EUKA